MTLHPEIFYHAPPKNKEVLFSSQKTVTIPQKANMGTIILSNL